MPSSGSARLATRSTYARGHRIERRTKMNTTKIIDVEDALHGRVPPGGSGAVGRLVRRGGLLVKPAQGLRVTHDEAEQALEAVRERDF